MNVDRADGHDGGIRELALWLCKPFDGKTATVGNGTMIGLGATSWAAAEGSLRP